MKNIKIMLVSFMLLLVAFFCSCGKTLEPYAVLVENGGKSNELKCDFDEYSETIRKVNKNKEKIIDYSFQGEIYKINYLYSTESVFDADNLDYYGDNNFTFAFSPPNGYLQKITTEIPGKSIIPYGKTLQNKQEYISWLKTIIFDVFNEDVSGYYLTCETCFALETFDDFVIVDDEEAGDYFYSFTFQKEYDGIKDAQIFRVMARRNGDVSHLLKFMINDENASLPVIDSERVDYTIDQAIKHFKKNDSSIRDCKTRSKTLTKSNGEWVIIVGLDIEHFKAGENYSKLIKIMLKL